MSNEKCPNCSQFQFKKETSLMGYGLFLIFGVPVLAVFTSGGSNFYGGNLTLSSLTGIMLISAIIGVVLVVLHFIGSNDTESYKCKNCGFRQEYYK